MKTLEEHIIMLHLACIEYEAPGAQLVDAKLTVEQQNRICGEMFQIWLVFYGPQASGNLKKPHVEKLLAGVRRWHAKSAKISEIYQDPLLAKKALKIDGRTLEQHIGRLVGVDSAKVKTWEDYQNLLSGFHAWIEEKV